MAQVLAIVADLMLGSRVEETLRSAGHEVSWVHSVPASTDAEAIVADLEVVDAAEVVALGAPALGFYSHTDVETKRAAEAAGFALAVPRSRMARELPELVAGLLD